MTRLLTVGTLTIVFVFTLLPQYESVASDAFVPVTGDSDPSLEPFDQLLSTFIQEHHIPGAALTVVKDGRLVVARGYGWANLRHKEPVKPNSLFRIASLSKSITAAAILQLVDRGKLSLDDKPFELLQLEPCFEQGRHLDSRLKSITVLQLLQHTGGFDRKRSFDPMFRSVQIAKSLGHKPPATTQDIIRYMWGRPLDFAPGTRYAYSNFGYCVLGCVVETVSGMPYQRFVRKQILAPLGIQNMRIGKTSPQERFPNEVAYYTYEGPKQSKTFKASGVREFRPSESWTLPSLEAHGGWIASAVDLARFATTFDDAEHCPILSTRAVRTLFARPQGTPGVTPDGRPKAVYYGCGWQVRPKPDGRANSWHTGSLPGTATLMVRRHDGLNWIVLFNTRYNPEGKSLTNEIDPLLHRAANAVRRWPKYDLFRHQHD